ncbi:MAG: hypothetical protein ABI340_01940 [Nitrososphaera sp.]|jgi:hypothetical protein
MKRNDKIIIAILIIGVVLLVSIPILYVPRIAIPSTIPNYFIPYAMKSVLQNGAYIEFIELYTNGIPDSMTISNNSNEPLNNCSLYYVTKIVNNTLSSTNQVLENGGTWPILLKGTSISLNDSSLLSLYCKNPSISVLWPHMMLDKTEFSNGDVVLLKGQVRSLSDMEITLHSYSLPSNLWQYSSEDIQDKKNVTANQDGTFDYSYTIPDDVKHDSKYLINVKNGNEEYAIGFLVR